MAASGCAFGDSAIIRVAGLPIRCWTDGGDAELFALLRELDETQARYAALAPAVADRIGRELVPHAALSKEQRAAVLRLRRLLHRAAELDGATAAATATTARHVAGNEDLAAAIAEAVDACEATAALGAATEKAVRRAQESAASFPWCSAREVRAVETIVRATDPQIWPAIEAHLARGESWSDKRLRHWSDHLWRLVGRAATKSTPRGWFGHVALVGVDDAGDGTVRLDAECATEWIENVHTQRVAVRAGTAPDDDGVLLTLAPIRWRDGEHLEFWVADPVDPAEMTQVRLRYTDLLGVVCDALAAGPVGLDELVATVAPPADGSAREALARFADHLAGIGVVQLSRSSRQRLVGWCQPRPGLVDPVTAGEGYLDVYRRTTGTLDRTLRDQLESLVEPALRVIALVSSAGGSAHPGPEDLDELPRSLLSVVRGRIRQTDGHTRSHPAHGWQAPDATGTPYDRLVEAIAARADDGPVDVTTSMLDEIGAPSIGIDWPIDCLFRIPGAAAGFTAVLEQVFPAGTIDARFVPALERLHGTVPHAEAYRRFLRQVQDATAIPFVELLIPPMTRYAANAVRRPVYTDLWTGDADAGLYGRAEGEYIPLDALTVRLAGGAVVVEADGRRVWPIYHATRTPLAPWTTVAELLLSAAPRPARWMSRRLHRSLDLFPERTHLPRITVDGGLVLAGAQWRIEQRGLWDQDATPVAKARALEGLCHRLALPRWVFASGPSGKPTPCDLASITAIRTLERITSAGGAVVVAEMVPAPGDLLVSDALHGGAEVVSEVLVRLPGATTPEELAARAAGLVLDMDGR